MPRTKTVVPGRKRRRKVMTAVKGNRGGRRKLYQTARETLMRSLQFAYRGPHTLGANLEDWHVYAVC